MDYLTYLFGIVVLIGATLASITVWARRALRIKVLALLLTALLMPTVYASFVGLLGKPKPVTMEWAVRAVPEATVLGASIRENEAIYLWLQVDEILEPRAYVLPWNRETAQQLQQAMRQAEADGTGVRVRRPFDRAHDSSQPLFYAEPQPALPLKTPGAG
ncbi:MAG: hypothetical protein ACE5Q3_16065 [Alphaproteobacteria bacterium]